MAIVPIPEKPVLPQATGLSDPAALKYSSGLNRSLYDILSMIARRSNASVWIDPGDDQAAGKLLKFTGIGNKVAALDASPALLGRTITGTANQIVVANGDGIGGNPTLSLPRIVTLSGTAVGSSSFEYLQFSDSAGTRGGYVGEGSAGNTDMYLVADLSNINLIANNGQVNLSSGQLGFPSVQNPSANPNTLDDYEEGSWSPAFALGSPTGTAGFAYSNQRGSYVKIGQLVLVKFFITATTKGSGTGTVYLTGLPFTSSSSVVVPATLDVSQYSGTTGMTKGIQGIQVSTGATSGPIYATDSFSSPIGVNSPLTDGNIANSFQILGSGVYQAAS